MDFLYNINEYYDELYPTSNIQKQYFQELAGGKMPARYLRIGCGTGALEHWLAKEGHDVTGIETSKDMLEAANRRRRMPNMAVRYFQMTTIEMTRFLGKSFYDVISCLNDRIIYIHDKTLMRKFFYDCKTLLAPGGTFVIQTSNFNLFNTKPMTKLPTRESIRAKLFTQLWTNDDGHTILQQDLEHSASRVVPVLKNVEVMTITPEEITAFANEAGFTSINIYSGFDLMPYTPLSESVVFIIK